EEKECLSNKAVRNIAPQNEPGDYKVKNKAKEKRRGNFDDLPAEAVLDDKPRKKILAKNLRPGSKDLENEKYGTSSKKVINRRNEDSNDTPDDCEMMSDSEEQLEDIQSLFNLEQKEEAVPGGYRKSAKKSSAPDYRYQKPEEVIDGSRTDTDSNEFKVE
ncbi:23607_t:CDS:2, partial [Gigaspora rosea]